MNISNLKKEIKGVKSQITVMNPRIKELNDLLNSLPVKARVLLTDISVLTEEKGLTPEDWEKDPEINEKLKQLLEFTMENKK